MEVEKGRITQARVGTQRQVAKQAESKVSHCMAEKQATKEERKEDSKENAGHAENLDTASGIVPSSSPKAKARTSFLAIAIGAANGVTRPRTVQKE